MCGLNQEKYLILTQTKSDVIRFTAIVIEIVSVEDCFRYKRFGASLDLVFSIISLNSIGFLRDFVEKRFDSRPVFSQFIYFNFKKCRQEKNEVKLINYNVKLKMFPTRFKTARCSLTLTVIFCDIELTPCLYIQCVF